MPTTISSSEICSLVGASQRADEEVGVDRAAAVSELPELALAALGVVGDQRQHELDVLGLEVTVVAHADRHGRDVVLGTLLPQVGERPRQALQRGHGDEGVAAVVGEALHVLVEVRARRLLVEVDAVPGGAAVLVEVHLGGQKLHEAAALERQAGVLVAPGAHPLPAAHELLGHPLAELRLDRVAGPGHVGDDAAQLVAAVALAVVALVGEQVRWQHRPGRHLDEGVADAGGGLAGAVAAAQQPDAAGAGRLVELVVLGTGGLVEQHRVEVAQRVELAQRVGRLGALGVVELLEAPGVQGEPRQPERRGNFQGGFLPLPGWVGYRGHAGMLPAGSGRPAPRG